MNVGSAGTRSGRVAGSWRDDVVVADPGEVVGVELTGEERFMLDPRLVECGGPARCTHAMAVAMGFADVQDLFAQADRILGELGAGRPLTRCD